MADDIAIGIDLGTSYSCVSVVQNGEPIVIPNEWGERTHASVVSFLEDGSVLVGNAAKKNIITNAESTVYSAKRLIGRYYFSDEVKKAQTVMPYKIIEGQNNSVRIDANELPINAELDSIEQVAVPAWRSAVKVVFPVRKGRGALLKIMLDDGEVAPAGAIVQIEGDKQEFYVARRGEAFVTGLQSNNRVLLNWKDKQCKFEVTLLPETPDETPRLGPLLCKGVAR